MMIYTVLSYFFVIAAIVVFLAVFITFLHYFLGGLFYLLDILLDPIFYPSKKTKKDDDI